MALIVSLVLLLSMTLLAIAAIQNTSLEERMAGNARSENIALQAAESALRAGETWIDSLTTLPTAGNSGPLWYRADGTNGPKCSSTSTPGTPWWFCWAESDWSGKGTAVSNAVKLVYVAGSNTVLSGARIPYYVIEEDGMQRTSLVVGQQQDRVNQGNRYRVTARGLDPGGRGEVLLQSRYVRLF
jgi:type IV pilus assembly protein PilX